MDKTSASRSLLTEVEQSVSNGLKRVFFSSSTRDEIWFTQTAWPSPRRLTRVQSLIPWQRDMPPCLIDFQRVYLRSEASSMTIADGNAAVFDKSPDSLGLGPKLFGGVPSADITLREIQTREMLRKNPHPHPCVYRGVTDWNLTEIVYERHPFGGDTCFQAVERAVKHVHYLGSIHYDLKPENIFYSFSEKRFVLGDFDCVHRIGTKLWLKNGARGWLPLDLTQNHIASEEIDWYGLAMLKLWLEKKANGKAKKGEELARTYDIVVEATEMLKGFKAGS